MTTKKKRTVFISSTYEDLIPHRLKVWELLSDYDVDIRGMERFGARTESPLQTCLAEVEQSDIYVGIIAMKLGSIDNSSGKSFTQLEYEKASDLNREIFIYLINEKDSKISPSHIDLNGKHEKLKSFKSFLKKRHTIDTFVDENDLAEKLERKFDELLSKESSKGKDIDEYQKAKKTIERFLLVPKAFSGREIKLKVKFKSDPFPASKAICSSFSLDYGNTIGIEIDIINPKTDDSFLEYLFIDSNKTDAFWDIQKDKEVEIYAQLQFSEEPIANQKANFFKRISVSLPGIIRAPSIFTGLSGYSGLNPEIIEAEGHIILKLTDILK